MAKKGRGVVLKANALIEASYRLTVSEQKIVMALASLVQPEDENFKEYSFTIKDFMALIGIKNKSKYREVQETTKKLMQKVFEFRQGNVLTQVAWLAGAQYHEGEGRVDLCFAPWLKPFLLELKSHFTKYKLENVIQLNSSYSVRIYELLKQYETIGTRFFKVDELRYILYVEDLYPLYANFKSKVLLVAQKELAEKTDICFTFEEVKTGRKVTGLKFFIKKNTASSPIDEIDMFDEGYLATLRQAATGEPLVEPNDHLQPIRERLAAYGFKPQAITSVLKRYDPEYITENLDIVEKAYRAGLVKDLPAYTHSALKEDYRKTMTAVEKERKAEYERIRTAAEAEIAATAEEEPVDLNSLDPQLRDKFKAILERVKMPGGTGNE